MVVVKRGVRGKAEKRGLKRKAPQEEDIQLSSDEEFDFETEPEEKKTILVEESDEDSGNDSDKELQIALRDGLLKDGLNMVVEKKRPIINKTAEIKQKIAKYAKKLPWIETLDVVSKSTLTKEMINNDFEREMQFYKQAEKAVQNAVPKLLAMGVKVLRPTDYYAEMAKSDDHMQKVRKRLLKVQEGKERQEAIRRMREEKKFANKVQKQALQNKSNEKKKLMEAVKKHKKGMKQQLEDMLSNVKRYNLDKDDDDKPSRGAPSSASNDRRGGGNFGGPNSRSKNFKRQFKDQKYGYGGKKKGMKRNTKESFESAFQKSGGRAGGSGGGRGGRGGRGGSRGGGRGRGGGRR